MKHILMIGLLALALSGCNSFLKEYSQSLARVKTVADLDELLVGDAYYPAVAFVDDGGWYGVMSNEDYDYNPFTHCVHFMSDELKQNDRTNAGDVGMYMFYGYFTWQRQVGINEKETSVGRENEDWAQAYDFINVTNMILPELDEVEALKEEEERDKVRIEGEARFLRALYYFTLVNLYAEPYVPGKAETTPGVPLKLTSYIEDRDFERTSLNEVYGQIIEDLEQAAECLSKSDFKGIYRANIDAVNLLLSRVYLYMQDYANARKYAQLVIDRKPALQDLNTFIGEDNVLTAQNPEVIFSMGGDYMTYYMRGFDYEDEEGEYGFYVSDDLVEAFDGDENDLRLSLYIGEGEYGYVYKKIYWGRAHVGSACSVSDNFLFRTAEAYLTLAEAAAFGNDEAKAREMLVQLQANRFIAGNAPVVNESGEALIKLIQKERQREFCLEGHRWYDLRRYTVLPEGKGKWNKAIRHSHTEFSESYGYGSPIRTRVFRLDPNSNCFTLALPKEVLAFQTSLGVNHRTGAIVESDVEMEPEDEDDDWDY